MIIFVSYWKAYYASTVVDRSQSNEKRKQKKKTLRWPSMLSRTVEGIEAKNRYDCLLKKKRYNCSSHLNLPSNKKKTPISIYLCYSTYLPPRQKKYLKKSGIRPSTADSWRHVWSQFRGKRTTLGFMVSPPRTSPQVLAASSMLPFLTPAAG